MKISRADQLYGKLREMAVDFRLKPGVSINEAELASQLDASRTPLREALNRLTAEGLMNFEPGKGFFSRRLSIREITDLYEVRTALEIHGLKLLGKNPDVAALRDLELFLKKTADHSIWSMEELLSFDERFHETLAGLAGNQELLNLLKMTNAKIRYFRWVDMETRRPSTQLEHMRILEAVLEGKTRRAASLMQNHIRRRSDQISAAVKECHARLFVMEESAKPVFVDEVAL